MLLEILVTDLDFEWLMIYLSHIKVHPHAAGARGRNRDMDRTKGAQLQDTLGRGCAWYASPNVLLQRVPSLIAHKLTLVKA